jgi:hypothetical protein
MSYICIRILKVEIWPANSKMENGKTKHLEYVKFIEKEEEYLQYFLFHNAL